MENTLFTPSSTKLTDTPSSTELTKTPSSTELTKISSSTELTKTPYSTELTDINIDCLEGIFEHLTLTELLNVANYNNHLKKAAELVFIRFKHGKNWVKLQDYIHHESGIILEEDGKIRVNGIKTCLKFLRCFGHLLTKVTFHIIEQKNRPYIAEYLNEFCGETLNEIVFETGISDDYIKSPFLNVQNVHFTGNCLLSTKKLRFNDWFPKMRSLDFMGLKTELNDRGCIEDHFPHLEQLAIGTSQNFSKENILNAIQLNQNLKKVRLHWDWSENLMRQISERLEKLECLEIDCFVEDATNFKGDPIHFGNVKELKMSLLRKYDCLRRFRGVNSIPIIPLTSGLLTQFSLKADFRLNQRFLEFIAKHPTITKLSLDVDCASNQHFSDKLKIGRALPLLTDINFNDCRFCLNGAIRFLDEFKSIDHFSFKLSTLNQFDELKLRLGQKWQATIGFLACVELHRSAV